ncbi:hypothetical protein Fmac_003440 [Flemingia macrophylla]|uniref:Uncharacterized protein n=1 Tax=Flemingia macrophylla TaxID=520843 RepID=A0ABD1NMS4_9FABA
MNERNRMAMAQQAWIEDALPLLVVLLIAAHVFAMVDAPADALLGAISFCHGQSFSNFQPVYASRHSAASAHISLSHSVYAALHDFHGFQLGEGVVNFC